MTKAELGRAGEALAARLIEQSGYQVLCRNYRAAGGEIDLIAQNEQYLAFVEVKTRSTIAFGSPAEAVNFRKQTRLAKAAAAYCLAYPTTHQPRFDIVEVIAEPGEPPNLQAHWLQNAFDAPDSYQSI